MAILANPHALNRSLPSWTPLFLSSSCFIAVVCMHRLLEAVDQMQGPCPCWIHLRMASTRLKPCSLAPPLSDICYIDRYYCVCCRTEILLDITDVNRLLLQRIAVLHTCIIQEHTGCIFNFDRQLCLLDIDEYPSNPLAAYSLNVVLRKWSSQFSSSLLQNFFISYTVSVDPDSYIGIIYSCFLSDSKSQLYLT